MLEHWIQPLNPSAYHEDYLAGDRIGTNLSRIPDNEGAHEAKRAVALIGGDVRWMKFVRRHLYRFGYRMPDISIHDLGDLRRTDPDFVTGPLLELLTSGVCPVLVGGHTGLMKAMRQSLSQWRGDYRPVVAHESIPEVLSEEQSRIRVVGIQQHLIGRNLGSHIEAMHLSQVRSSLDDAETLIRESNCLAFDLSAMSSLDVPSQRSHSSSGFTTEEACTLMRSAGLHGDTQAVMISGHDPMSLQLDQSANVVAQMLWYFLEAYQQCIKESPLHSTHCTAYVVHLDAYDTDLKFYKSERTGRWWVQCDPERSATISPCTYADYCGAINGQVTERIITCTTAALERINE